MSTQPENIQRNGDEPAANDSTGDDRHLDDRHLTVEEQLAAARDQLEEYRREASQNLDAAQRAQAELVNCRLIAKVLPVMEELDLAVAHAGDSGPNASWLEGVKLIQRKLANLLQSEGVSEITAVGAPFNPVEHEALGTEKTSEYPPGYVTAGLRPGYRLHDRVIQPAQVMVATEPDRAENTKDASNEEVIENG